MRIFSEILLAGSAFSLNNNNNNCEQCPGKNALQCKEGWTKVVNGTFKTNCNKKCKNWECVKDEVEECVCDDQYETCDPGFESVLTNTTTCDCGGQADVYGCQCVPCSDEGPEECDEDQYLMANYDHDSCNPPNVCVQTSCNDCERCPIGLPFCGDGYKLVESQFQTKDCNKTCSTFTCEACPAAEVCSDGYISETTLCEGENCECDIVSSYCRKCDVCQDSKQECQPWENEILLESGNIEGECGTTCDTYGCECSNPCVNDAEPFCSPEDKLKKWSEEDACGNTCKRYECVSNDPEGLLADVFYNMKTSTQTMWGDRKNNWIRRVVNSFENLVEDALDDYDKKNQACEIYGFWSPDLEEEDEEEDEDENRGLDEVCKEDAKTIRGFFRQFRSWTATFNAPCGDNAGDEPVVANRLARKSQGLQKRAVERRCRFLKKSNA